MSMKEILEIGNDYREKKAKEWEKDSLSVSDGLMKEFKENNNVGNSALLGGILLAFLAIFQSFGFLETSNLPDYFLTLTAFISGMFIIGGISMKSSKKDIAYTFALITEYEEYKAESTDES